MKVLQTALVAATLIATVTVVLPSQSALYAQSNNTATNATAPIEVPVDTVVRGDAGKEYELKKLSSLKNGHYKVTVASKNQSSVHPDTDIVVRANGDEVVVRNVESGKFVEKTADGTLEVTDGKVTLYVKLGADKVFSGGVTVTLTYVPPKEEPKEVEVCDPETGEIITVTEDKEDQYLPVGDAACEEGEGGGEEVPETLPEAGPAATLMITGLAGGAGALAHNRLLRNKRK